MTTCLNIITKAEDYSVNLERIFGIHVEKRKDTQKGYNPCKGYSLCKIVSFRSKIKNAKHMRKTILKEQYRCSLRKTAKKNTKYIEEMRQYWKSATLQRL